MCQSCGMNREGKREISGNVKDKVKDNGSIGQGRGYARGVG